MRLMHLSATRDPGVGTAETNRIVEQVLLNLKTLFLSFSPPLFKNLFTLSFTSEINLAKA